MNDNAQNDPRLHAIPDIHGHAKGEHKAFIDERPIPLSARMLFLWFYHACRRGWPRFLMVTDHMNYLTFEDPAAINLVRRALKLAQAGDLYGAAETASVEVGQAAIVSEGLRRGMRYSIGAEVDNDPRSRPDAQNIVDAMKPDGMIRSVHFLTIDHPTHGPNWNWPFDNPEFADVFELVGTEKTWELYMATLLDAIERLPGNIVGHFYVPALFGHWPDDAVLDGYENQLVDACEARGLAVELNTRFLYREHSEEEKAKYLAAHRRLLRKCKAKNVGVAVGSDAHSPKDQGGGFDLVLALLDECEINEIVFPLAGRLARVALRVERKVEPLPEAVHAALDDRKAVRKTRLNDPPQEPAAAWAADEGEAVAAPKAKARPKRSRARTTETAEAAESAVVAAAAGPAETAALEAVAASAGADGGPQPSHPAPLLDHLAVPLENPATPHVMPLAVAAAETDAGATPAAQTPDTVIELPEPATLEAAEPKRTPEPPEPASIVVETLDAFIGSEPLSDIVTEPQLEPILADQPADADDAADAEDREDTADAVLAATGEDNDEPVAESIRIVVETPPAEPFEEAPQAASELAPEPEHPAAHKPLSKPPAAPKQTQPSAAPSAARPKTAAVKVKPAAKKPAKPAAKSLAKASPKKAAAKKTTAKKVAIPKAAAKKAAPKKPAARKPAAKKAAVRATGAKKSSVKKAAAKKASPKKPAQRRR